MRPAHEVIADLHAEHSAERAAWARLVLAERACARETARFVETGERNDLVIEAEYEVTAAREALRDLGVESPALSDEP